MRDARGFTLVEILVVLLIISVMVGVVIARFPSFTQDEEFLRESERIRLVMELLRDEAVIASTEYAFEPDKDTYTFHVYNEFEQGWIESTQAPFREYTLPEGLELVLRVEDTGFSLTPEDEETEPPVLVMSSGEVTPFELYVIRSTDRAERVLRADGYSRLVWEGEDEEGDD